MLNRASTLSFALAFFLAIATQNASAVPVVSESEIPTCVAAAVDFGAKMGARLDYSPESLAFADNVLNGLHMYNVPLDRHRNRIVVLGCYAGEVMVRNLQGKWIYPTDQKTRDTLGEGPFVQLPKGVVVNPLDKASRLAESGLEHSLVQYYALAKSASQ